MKVVCVECIKAQRVSKLHHTTGIITKWLFLYYVSSALWWNKRLMPTVCLLFLSVLILKRYHSFLVSFLVMHNHIDMCTLHYCRSDIFGCNFNNSWRTKSAIIKWQLNIYLHLSQYFVLWNFTERLESAKM